MSPTLVGPKLDNDDNETEIPEVGNVKDDQASVMEKKVDEVVEDQYSLPSKKQKNDKYNV